MSQGANHVLFKDRADAGRLLAQKLTSYSGTDAIILGIPRGGVLTAVTVGIETGLPVDTLVVKKIPSPNQEEFSIGAVAQGGVVVMHWRSAHRSGADEDWVTMKVREISETIKKYMRMYRKNKKPIAVAGRTVILVDDGSATGATMEAAVLWARKKNARKIVVALPVASAESVSILKPEVSDVVVYAEIPDMTAVGDSYAAFPQISDGEVIQSLV